MLILFMKCCQPWNLKTKNMLKLKYVQTRLAIVWILENNLIDNYTTFNVIIHGWLIDPSWGLIGFRKSRAGSISRLGAWAMD